MVLIKPKQEFMKKLLFLIVLLFQLNFKIFAEQNYFHSNNNEVHIYIPNQNRTNNEWSIDEFKIQKEMLQEKSNTWVFENEEEFNLKIEELKNLNSEVNTILSDEYVETENVAKKLWETKFFWDKSWEKKFADWMEDEIDESFFTKYHISTDCADAMIALRWIFSRINGLAMGSTLAGSGVLFTNESYKNAWNSLSRDDVWFKDQVFLAAIDYIMDNAYTNTLWDDSFPVAINDVDLHAGTFYLYKTFPPYSGHTQIILRSRKQLIIAESTVPKRVRDLMIRNFYPPTPTRGYSGLRTFKWLRKGVNGKNYLLEGINHPHYSEEQYNEELAREFGSFYNVIFYRLKLKYNYRKHLRKLKKMLKTQLNSRIEIVNEGINICMNSSCNPGTINYENWSTSSRDKRIKETFHMMNTVVNSYGNKFFKMRFKSYLRHKSYKVNEDLKIKIGELKNIFENELYSSEPTASVFSRWGHTPN